MVIFEPSNFMEVDTPKGRGRVWLVTEYGPETEKLFLCIIAATGEFWEFTNRQIRATSNVSFGRGSIQKATDHDPSVSHV